MVTGWCTADLIYQNLAMRLLGDLDDLGYDTSNFKQNPKPAGKRWEAITMMKPQQVLFALQRNPGNIVILVDVDCRVLAPLDDLANNLRGDVSFYIRSRYRRSGGRKFGCMVVVSRDYSWEEAKAEDARYKAEQAKLSAEREERMAKQRVINDCQRKEQAWKEEQKSGASRKEFERRHCCEETTQHYLWAGTTTRSPS